MKVILTSRIKTLGEIGDIRIVADGYAKNYLLPKKYALIYSDKNYEYFKNKKDIIEKEDSQNKIKALENQKKIENIDIIVFENAGDNDRLYGSINTVRLALLTNELIKSNDLVKSNVVIHNAIKFLGKHEIEFHLHHDIVFKKEIIVARTKEEAEKIKKANKIEKTEKSEDQTSESKKNLEEKSEIKGSKTKIEKKSITE